MDNMIVLSVISDPNPTGADSSGIQNIIGYFGQSGICFLL
jgi:hypothetical protein